MIATLCSSLWLPSAASGIPRPPHDLGFPSGDTNQLGANVMPVDATTITAAQGITVGPVACQPLAVSSTALFELAFPASGVPPGRYQIFAALIRRGALADNRIDPDDVLAFDLKEVVFAP